MKQYQLPILIALAAGLMACSSGQPRTAQPSGLSADCPFPGTSSPAPAWVCLRDVEYGMFALGSAEQSRAGESFTRQQAMLDGRAQLAQRVGAQIGETLNAYVEASSTGSRESVSSVAERVTRSFTSQTLSGSRMAQYAVAPDGKYYVLVVMDEADAVAGLSAVMQEEAQNSQGEEREIWDRVQTEADEGFDALAREMARWRD